jgi:ribA/ribD-fused uncharacterized protein
MKRQLDTIITDDAIYGFFGDYRFLSNFHACPKGVLYKDIIYPSSEHAYMSAKSHDISYKQMVLNCGRAENAKKIGRSVKLRDDWESVKLDVMYEVVSRKFSRDSDLMAQLLNTGDKNLVEMNWWGDRFWGVDANKNGENNLGKILVSVRNDFFV